MAELRLEVTLVTKGFATSEATRAICLLSLTPVNLRERFPSMAFGKLFSILCNLFPPFLPKNP